MNLDIIVYTAVGMAKGSFSAECDHKEPMKTSDAARKFGIHS